MISINKSKLAPGIKNARINDTQPRINSRWTREEELIAVQAIRKYGKDFVAVAEVLGNKNEAHIKTFYVNNEKRYKLNDFVAEWEAQTNGDEVDGPTSEKRARSN